LIERFGTEGVAEVTGRTRRLVVNRDGRQKLENRTARSNLLETDAFMRGDKRILVFSDAGGTGRSYHACLGAGTRRGGSIICSSPAGAPTPPSRAWGEPIAPARPPRRCSGR
jgi:hypothetical protein